MNCKLVKITILFYPKKGRRKGSQILLTGYLPVCLILINIFKKYYENGSYPV